MSVPVPTATAPRRRARADLASAVRRGAARRSASAASRSTSAASARASPCGGPRDALRGCRRGRARRGRRRPHGARRRSRRRRLDGRGREPVRRRRAGRGAAPARPGLRDVVDPGRGPGPRAETEVHHLIDPRTRSPAEGDLRSVTVVGHRPGARRGVEQVAVRRRPGRASAPTADERGLAALWVDARRSRRRQPRDASLRRLAGVPCRVTRVLRTVRRSAHGPRPARHRERRASPAGWSASRRRVGRRRPHGARGSSAAPQASRRTCCWSGSCSSGCCSRTRTRPLRRPSSAVRIRTHVSLSVFTLVFTVLHIVVLATDKYAGVGWWGAFVPMGSTYRPLPVTLGRRSRSTPVSRPAHRRARRSHVAPRSGGRSTRSRSSPWCSSGSTACSPASTPRCCSRCTSSPVARVVAVAVSRYTSTTVRSDVEELAAVRATELHGRTRRRRPSPGPARATATSPPSCPRTGGRPHERARPRANRDRAAARAARPDAPPSLPRHGTESLTGRRRARPRRRTARSTAFGVRPRSAAATLSRRSRQVRLTGRGGGHFPTAAKWRSVLAAGAGGTVVANGAEGEPGSAEGRRAPADPSAPGPRRPRRRDGGGRRGRRRRVAPRRRASDAPARCRVRSPSAPPAGVARPADPRRAGTRPLPVRRGHRDHPHARGRTDPAALRPRPRAALERRVAARCWSTTWRRWPASGCSRCAAPTPTGHVAAHRRERHAPGRARGGSRRQRSATSSTRAWSRRTDGRRRPCCSAGYGGSWVGVGRRCARAGRRPRPCAPPASRSVPASSGRCRHRRAGSRSPPGWCATSPASRPVSAGPACSVSPQWPTSPTTCRPGASADGTPPPRRASWARSPGRGACRHPDGALRMLSSALTVFAHDVRRHRRGRTCDAPTYAVLPLPGEESEPGRHVAAREARPPRPSTGSRRAAHRPGGVRRRRHLRPPRAGPHRGRLVGLPDPARRAARLAPATGARPPPQPPPARARRPARHRLTASGRRQAHVEPLPRAVERRASPPRRAATRASPRGARRRRGPAPARSRTPASASSHTVRTACSRSARAASPTPSRITTGAAGTSDRRAPGLGVPVPGGQPARRRHGGTARAATRRAGRASAANAATRSASPATTSQPS